MFDLTNFRLRKSFNHSLMRFCFLDYFRLLLFLLVLLDWIGFELIVALTVDLDADIVIIIR